MDIIGTRDFTTANTIVAQMGGLQRLQTMIRAKIILDDNSVSLKFMRGRDGINMAQITYNRGQDLYDVRFYATWGLRCDLVHEVDQVSCDLLIDCFERSTELYLHL